MRPGSLAITTGSTPSRAYASTIDTLPEYVDRSRPNFVAEAIEAALRQDGIEVDCSDLFSDMKIDLPTAQLDLHRFVPVFGEQ
jgi:hypothetical protein